MASFGVKPVGVPKSRTVCSDFETLCAMVTKPRLEPRLEATRAVHGLSHGQVLPDDAMAQLAHLRLSSVILDGGT